MLHQVPITEGPNTGTQRRTGVEEEREKGDKEEEKRDEDEVVTSPSASLPVMTGNRTEPRSPKSALVEETPRSSGPVEEDFGPDSGRLSETHVDFGPIREATSGSHSETQSQCYSTQFLSFSDTQPLTHSATQCQCQCHHSYGESRLKIGINGTFH